MPTEQTEYRLETSVRAVLDANGEANQINIGPAQQTEKWKIERFSSSGAANAKLQIMRGNSFDSTRQLDVTTRAISASSETELELQAGETISFWWTLGTAGAQMTCSINGTRIVRGRRAY